MQGQCILCMAGVCTQKVVSRPAAKDHVIHGIEMQ